MTSLFLGTVYKFSSILLLNYFVTLSRTDEVIGQTRSELYKKGHREKVKMNLVPSLAPLVS